MNMSITTEYRNYFDTQELMADLIKGYALYQAPMDHRPYTIKIRRLAINFQSPEKSTISFWTSETGVLTVAIADHFKRFMKRN